MDNFDDHLSELRKVAAEFLFENYPFDLIEDYLQAENLIIIGAKLMKDIIDQNNKLNNEKTNKEIAQKLVDNYQ